jgi:ubiquinone/menaquinone biosynthesis C-methylase UbiE
MTTPTTLAPKPDYGIDAPPIIRTLLLLGGSALALALMVFVLDVPHPAGAPLFAVAVIVGLNFLLNAAGMLWYSKVTKLRARERFLDLVAWQGRETVLDVGCGRGLLLIGAARRLTTGKAVGVDLWQTADLSGNRPEATLENARREGVADRVEVKDGDARHLPFADASFEVVVSGLALHNIAKVEERQQAIREIVRVLQPGGQLALVDIQCTGEYARVLEECGCSDVKRTASGWITWVVMAFTWASVQPYRVTVRKPALPVVSA